MIIYGNKSELIKKVGALMKQTTIVVTELYRRYDYL